MSGSQFHSDVVVVGSGPMGATTALALATYGVRVQVVNRWNWLAHTPRAHITNQRTMEVLRDLGVEDDAVRLGTPWEAMGDMTIATSFAGDELARLHTWGTGDARHGDYVRDSPCGMLDLIQPHMEQVLINRAAERGAELSFNTEYLGHEQDDEGVTVRLQDLASGRTYERRARFLVGADGARSQIADEIGLEIVGHHARAAHVYAYFKADLSRYAAHRPSILNYIMNPDVGHGEIGMGLLRAIRPWDEWIAGWGADPDGEPDLDPANALEKIRLLVGDPDLEAELGWIAPWHVNQAYATSYSRGRVFCGGDAVHRHPPSSGLGSNTSIQDGFNLAWKLAYVVKGHAGPRLLESYSDERAPVGVQIVARANQSRKDYAELHRAVRAAGATDAGGFLDSVVRADPAGARVRAELAAALRLKDYEFNAQGVELNQRYVSCAVVPEPGAGEERWQRDPQLHVQPTTRPGAKLPHAWLVDPAGAKISTLDLVGRGRMTLLTGLSGQVWAGAAASLSLPMLDVVTVGSREHRDLYCVWGDISEVPEDGAILVRPDGYVAWRHSQKVGDEQTATALLLVALAQTLDRPDLGRDSPEGIESRRAEHEAAR